MADFAEEKERGKVVDDLGQNPLMEKNRFWGFAMLPVVSSWTASNGNDHHHLHIFWLSGCGCAFMGGRDVSNLGGGDVPG